jgi:pimeloyl-ACP methyl ester carboxylesterase
MNAVLAHVVHRFVEVDGVRLFYRAAGPPDAPLLLALHGFPSASHQYRRLVEALGDRYRVIAPDYPGFGFSDAPSPADFGYSFDRLADVMEAFCRAVEVERFVLYAFDFGGPVGLRLAERHPEWIAGLVVQNANAYTEGLSEAARGFVSLRPGVPGAADTVHGILTLDATRGQYEGGAPEGAVAPEGWTLDQHFLDRPGRKDIQVALALDYHTNVARYPVWQAWLREYQPPTLIVWGRNDPFFTEAGAWAYRRDVPAADVHIFDTGHFALESHLPEIAPLVAANLDASWGSR